jgi:hypothetical protein
MASASKYPEMAELLHRRMEELGIETNRELQRRLARAGCEVGENMVSRWLTGQARPQGANLTAVLDVLNVVRPEERAHAERLAYIPSTASDEPVTTS